ncbi:hypothetical protein BHE74_00011198, partial [Ensete ventricosum]
MNTRVPVDPRWLDLDHPHCAFQPPQPRHLQCRWPPLVPPRPRHLQLLPLPRTPLLFPTGTIKVRGPSLYFSRGIATIRPPVVSISGVVACEHSPMGKAACGQGCLRRRCLWADRCLPVGVLPTLGDRARWHPSTIGIATRGQRRLLAMHNTTTYARSAVAVTRIG